MFFSNQMACSDINANQIYTRGLTSKCVLSKGLLRFGTELRYGSILAKRTIRNYVENFYKKYGTEIRYYIFLIVPYTFRTSVMHALHFCSTFPSCL